MSQDSIEEMKEALFPFARGMNLAELACRFILDQGNKNVTPQCDIGTLQQFVQFLKDKKYN